jgi:hypothetical protein
MAVDGSALNPQPKLRLFFACWPDAASRAGLATFGKPFTQQREIRNRLRSVSDRPFGGRKKFIYLMAHTPSLPRLAANCKRAISQLDRT